MRPIIDQLCEFLSVSYSHEEKENLLEELSVAKMKTNEAVNDTEIMVKLGQFKAGEGSFIRKGQTGGWREYFTDEQYAKMEQWKEDNCKLYDVPTDRLWS